MTRWTRRLAAATALALGLAGCPAAQVGTISTARPRPELRSEPQGDGSSAPVRPMITNSTRRFLSRAVSLVLRSSGRS